MLSGLKKVLLLSVAVGVAAPGCWSPEPVPVPVPASEAKDQADDTGKEVREVKKRRKST